MAILKRDSHSNMGGIWFFVYDVVSQSFTPIGCLIYPKCSQFLEMYLKTQFKDFISSLLIVWLNESKFW